MKHQTIQLSLFLGIGLLLIVGLLSLSGIQPDNAQAYEPPSSHETITLSDEIGPAANTDIVINEVFYLGNSAAQDWIELKNVGSSTIDISNWWFCAQFNYHSITSSDLLDGADLSLTPGEIVRLQSWINLDNTSSDFGLYTTNNFASPSAMVDFVQWGTANNVGRSDIAAAKGIWTETSPGQYDFVPTASAGQSMAYDGSNGGGGLLTLSSDFANGTPTPGTDDPALRVSKEANPLILQPGEATITYTLTVTSTGNVSNTNVILTDTIPTNTSFITAAVTPNNGVLTWTLGDMLPPLSVTTRTFVVTTTATTGTTIVNSDYGVRSDQTSATGPPVEVSVATNSFIYLPVILKNFSPVVDEHAADLIIIPSDTE